MISRRRMVFQLTALLDLLLVVLFAQYLESHQTAQRATNAAKEAESHRQEAEARRLAANEVKQRALSDVTGMTEQIEVLTDENSRLREELAMTTMTAEERAARAQADLQAIGDVFRERLNVDPVAFESYLKANPAERERLREALEGFKGDSTASIIQHLRATAEFRKLSDLWEVHVYADNSARIEINGQEKAQRVRFNGADEFALKMIDVVKGEGEPKSLVLVLLTWEDAQLWAVEAAGDGAETAVTKLKTEWGAANLKRIELARLGYSPEAP